MKRILLGMAALALAAFTTAAQAQNSLDNLDCANWDQRDLPQQGMNICQQKDYEAADAQLNKVYRQLTAKLDAPAKALLVKAQRAWIAFRDSECTFETAESEGGSIHPMLYAGCMTALTKQRTKQLKELADQPQ